MDGGGEKQLQQLKSLQTRVEAFLARKDKQGVAELFGECLQLKEALEGVLKLQDDDRTTLVLEDALAKVVRMKTDLVSAEYHSKRDAFFAQEHKERAILQHSIADVADKWELLPAFVKSRGLVNQHIESFDHFLDVTLDRIRKANERIKCDADAAWYLLYRKLWVGTPSMEGNADRVMADKVTPQMCRLADLTYSAPIYVRVEYIRFQEVVILEEDIEIGRMPIMLRSKKCVLYRKTDEELARMGECPLDPGGYFVVRGQERVILIQEQLSKNRILVDNDRGFITASVTSSRVEIKSRTSVLMKKGRLYLKTNKFTDDIPIVIAMMALGVETIREMQEMVGVEEGYQMHMVPSVMEVVNMEPKIHTTSQALAYIGAKIRSRYPRRKPNAIDDARDAFHQVVLSHIPTKYGDFRLKAVYLACMCRRVIAATIDPTTLDDKDYYGNKRLEMAGDLMALLFENVFKNFNRELQRVAQTHLSRAAQSSKLDIVSSFNPPTITNALRVALATGNWNLARFNMERSGITQVLSRLSYLAMLGMMGRIRSQFEKSRKISGPRALQPSQWGVVCPTDTPEGETCGLVKNLALLTHITINVEEEPFVALAQALGTEDIRLFSGSELWSDKCAHVFLNGTLIGVHRKPALFIDKLRSLRRGGRINPYVSVSHSLRQHAITISCDAGRICRPLIIVRDKKPLIETRHCEELRRGLRTFDDCVAEGLVEFLDVMEEGDAMLALREGDITAATTHLEIEPLTILGIVAGLIPYPHHNQSPRNTYQCAMGKQSMGAIASNQFVRMDTMMYLLVYPQQPLVTSKTMHLINFDKLPAGHNTVIAVMSFTGYDIEDAIILNQASVDRGFGRCIYTRTHCNTLKHYPDGGKDELVTQTAHSADELAAMTQGARQKLERKRGLDEDGIVRPGSLLSPKDAYLERRKPQKAAGDADGAPADDAKRNATSVSQYKSPVEGAVDQVVLTRNDEGETVIKVRFRNVRTPEIGDKFSSRHGQKGVVGLIVPQDDMPFTDQGIVPDLVMNPHGFPSRMTVGKMLELLGSKAGVLEGELRDGTAFGGDKIEDLSRTLLSHGFHYRGKDYVTSGITGEPLTSYIFFGPVYYQKLKHMVYQKVHARSKGPIALLTRQPTEGRARDGGLRLGEMERDCLIAYGASSLLLERLMISSDGFLAYVCQQCGLLAYNRFVKRKGKDDEPVSAKQARAAKESKDVKETRYCSYCETGNYVVSLTMPYACKLLLQELTSMGVQPSLRLTDL